MKFIKKQNFFGWLVIVSAILAIVGMIIFGVTATSGYLAGQVWSIWPIVLTLIAFVLSFFLVLISDKLGRWGNVVLYAILGLLLASLMFFVLDRIGPITDVYFIPVNYPPAQGVTVTQSIVGIAFYGVSILAIIIAAFGKKLYKTAK